MESKLSVELKNTPGDTSLVLCSASCALNREETLSVHGICWLDNPGEENLLHIDASINQEDRT